MNEELFKKLMKMFGHLIDESESEIVDFAEMDDPDLEHVITVHPTKDGKLIFSLFQPEEWQMIESVAEIAGKKVEQVVSELEQENLVKKIVVDPKDYPGKNIH